MSNNSALHPQPLTTLSHFQGKYANLDARLISYGPCQTPTLGFVVDRHDEIQSFEAEPFWTIDVALEHAGRELTLKWSRDKLFSKDVALVFMELMKNQQQAVYDKRRALRDLRVVL